MITYIVLPGDTMWDIANKYGINLDDLIISNPQIRNPNLIYPGEIINIPSQSSVNYNVKKGDTLWDIAHKYGYNLNDLIELNPQIMNPALIFPNQVINMPGSPSTPSIPNVPIMPVTPDNMKDLEQEVIVLVNRERAKVGSPEISESVALNNVARIKSEDFINNNYFSHNSPTYGSPFDMLNSFEINYTAAAENIASGQITAEEVMNTWMSSPGHRANILNSTYNQIGVGIAKDNNGNLYWTQLFIRR